MPDSFTPNRVDSFKPMRDSFIPDNVTPKTNPVMGMINATIDGFKDVPSQIQDLMTIPARLLGTPHPPFVSKLATETIPYLAEKALTPIGEFTVPSMSFDDVKALFQKGKLQFTEATIEPTPLDIAWYGTLGGVLAKDAISLARWNMHLDKLIKTEEVRGTVMNNMPAFENLMNQVGIKTEGMDLEAKTNFILSQAKSSPKLGSAIMDLTRGKIIASTPKTGQPIEGGVVPPEGAVAPKAATPLAPPTAQPATQPPLVSPVLPSAGF